MSLSAFETTHIQTSPLETAPQQLPAAAVKKRTSLLALAFLTVCTLFVHGYHPFAEDAGIYVAGVEKMLQPQLFQHDAAFVVAHTRYSIFSHLFAEILKWTHIPLEFALFAAYLASIFVFLEGCLQLAKRTFQSPRMQWGSVLLASALYTLPVAATALWIMDPYVTARSFSTPFSVFALVACIDRAWKRCLLWTLLTAAMHPLMAAYLAIFLLTYALVAGNRWKTLAIVFTAGFATVATIYFATIQAALPDGYREAVLSRYYFFLSNWHWYEWMGLAAPLLLMMLIPMRRTRERNAVLDLSAACVVTGATTVLCTALLVHKDGSYFLAHLQFLRSFQLVYIVGVLLLGGFLARWFSGRLTALGFLLLLCTFCGMAYVAHQSFIGSAHIEWPFAAPKNPWQQAFLWVRVNTPSTAVFAADPGYTQLPGEDAQSFRAISLHSIYVDALKDGGVAAIFPYLAPQWKNEMKIETGINTMTDAQRISRFQNTPVSWLMLNADSYTELSCPYRNRIVKICRLR